MKKLLITIVTLCAMSNGFAQIRKPINAKDISSNKINQFVDTVDVYISIKDGILSNNEIYELFRNRPNEHNNLFLNYITINSGNWFDIDKLIQSKSSNKFIIKNFEVIEPINGVFPSIVSGGYTTIHYRLAQKATPDNPKVIVAALNNFFASKYNIEIMPGTLGETCSMGLVGFNDNLNLGSGLQAAYKLFNQSNAACGFIKKRIGNNNNVVQFVINRISYGK